MNWITLKNDQQSKNKTIVIKVLKCTAPAPYMEAGESVE